MSDDKPNNPPQKAVTLTTEQWAAIVQLISLGVRNADDNSLELGGRLLNEVKRQLG